MYACGAAEETRPQGPAATLPFGPLSGTGMEPRQGTMPSLEEIVSGVSIPAVEKIWVEQSILLLAIPSQRYTAELLAFPGTGVGAMQALQQGDLDILIGSGFVSELHSLQPVGLLHVNGRQVSPLEPYGYTRILGFNDEGLGVVHRSVYQRELFDSALQLGPGIIEQGKLDISEKDLLRPRFFRSFVALCHDKTVVGITTAPYHLRTLGEALLTAFDERTWHCQEVINLAGDRQAVLVAAGNGGSLFFHGDVQAHKVTLIGFRRRW